MLCKRTMRAALAPVIGLVGLLGATMVSAQEDLSAVIATKVVGGMEVDGPVTLASETLSGVTGMVTEGHYHVFTASSSVPAVAGEKPDRWLELRAEVDILLTNRGASDHYYIRYDFDGMVFSAAPPKPEITVPHTERYAVHRRDIHDLHGRPCQHRGGVPGAARGQHRHLSPPGRSVNADG